MAFVIAVLLSFFAPKGSCGLLSVEFSGLLRCPCRHVPCKGRCRGTEWNCPSRVVDADFAIVEDTEDGQQQQPSKKNENDGTQGTSPMSLLDLSISADPDIGNLRIPFYDGENCIDTKLSFMAELDGTQYAIGIPFDFPAALTLEKKNGEVDNLSPDSDENLELMELMAQQLKETVGDDLRLVRSPRVLTIAGPLEKYTKNWTEELLPKSADAATLLNQDDEDIASFLSFMKRELGEEEFTKTMNEEHTFDEDILNLFSVPGFGDSEGDITAFIKTELMEISSSSENEYALQQESLMETVVGKDGLTHDGVALKLVSYRMADGKRYSLVQLLKPIVLLAKQIAPSDDGETGELQATLANPPRFELLSPRELRQVSPRLEEICRVDMERLGWEFEE